MRIYNWDNKRMTVADVEQQGIWLGSDLGFSFCCGCNWRSGILPTRADVRDALATHCIEAHHAVMAGADCDPG